MNREEFENEMRNPDTTRKAIAVLARIRGITNFDDILQEARLNAWRGIASFQGSSRFSTWFCTIARNIALAHLRKQRVRDRHASVESVDDHHDPDDGMEARMAIQQAINQLTQDHQESLRFRLTGMSDAEAAEAIGIPTTTYRTRLYYARQALEKVLTRTNE